MFESVRECISDENFFNQDFEKIDFNSAQFENVGFTNCTFKDVDLKGIRVYPESNFLDCKFEDVTFTDETTFVSHRGNFMNCTFINCKFIRLQFDFTRFEDCEFLGCDFKNIDFNAASFENCKLWGKFKEVTFNGRYNTDQSIHKPLHEVDFSNAIFRNFVTFYDCDLRTSTPPRGKEFNHILYQVHSKFPDRLGTGDKDKNVNDLTTDDIKNLLDNL